MNPLALWQRNGKAQRLQDIKNRVLKNKEPILDAFSENIKGARLCPLYIGQKCIGGLCEFFRKYETLPDENGRKTEYFRCNVNQVANLQVEILNEIRLTNQLLTRLVVVFEHTAKQEQNK